MIHVAQRNQNGIRFSFSTNTIYIKVRPLNQFQQKNKTKNALQMENLTGKTPQVVFFKVWFMSP